jgi:hypothetical protein
MKIRVVPKGKRYIMIRLGVGPIYAERGGGPCLKTETTWRKLSGFWINTKWGCVWVMLRRPSL